MNSAYTNPKASCSGFSAFADLLSCLIFPWTVSLFLILPAPLIFAAARPLGVSVLIVSLLFGSMIGFGLSLITQMLAAWNRNGRKNAINAGVFEREASTAAAIITRAARMTRKHALFVTIASAVIIILFSFIFRAIFRAPVQTAFTVLIVCGLVFASFFIQSCILNWQAGKLQNFISHKNRLETNNAFILIARVIQGLTVFPACFFLFASLINRMIFGLFFIPFLLFSILFMAVQVLMMFAVGYAIKKLDYQIQIWTC